MVLPILPFRCLLKYLFLFCDDLVPKWIDFLFVEALIVCRKLVLKNFVMDFIEVVLELWSKLFKIAVKELMKKWSSSKVFFKDFNYKCILKLDSKVRLIFYRYSTFSAWYLNLLWIENITVIVFTFTMQMYQCNSFSIQRQQI